MLTRFFALVTLVLFSTLTFADEVNVPELTDRAVFAGSVQPSASQKEVLTSNLKELEDKNKVQMAVLVVDSIKPLSIEEYSMKVAEKWKLGLKGVDNGVLLVVATKDQKARIEVGKGLEGVLTDAMTKRIQVENMIPYFKRGEFAEGVVSVVAAINVKTTKEVPVITQAIEAKKASDEAAGNGTLFLMFFFGISAVVGIITFFVVRSQRKASSRRSSSSSRSSSYSDDTWRSSSSSSSSSSSGSSGFSGGGGDFGGGGSSTDW
jgi:uncharacterized protein